MFYIFIAVIVVAVAIYLSMIFVQRNNTKKIEASDAIKSKLMDMPVIESINETKKLNLTGESLKTFNNWKSKYDQIEKKSFSDIEGYLFDAETLNGRYSFFAVKRTLTDLNAYLEKTESSINDILEAFEQIRANEQDNQVKLDRLKASYQELRKQLLAKSFTYGGAIDELEKQLANLETDFDEASKLATSGDHQEARTVIMTLESDTKRLQEYVKRIPPCFTELETQFPEQMEEITTAHQQLVDEFYNFFDIDFDKEIESLNEQIDKAKERVAKLEIDDVETTCKEIAVKIDHLYDVLQAEIDARAEVEKRNNEVAAFIQHARQQNRELISELERLGQSYTLTHDELETAHILRKKIATIGEQYEKNTQLIADHKAVYSLIKDDFTDNEEQLMEIEQQQKTIDDDVSGLQQGESVALNSLENFEFDIRSLKRDIEKCHLPGLSKDYLDFFFMVSDEINRLGDALDQPLINLEEITKQLIMTQEDLNTLKSDTTDLIDAAMLTEDLLQYANRYRTSSSSVDQACKAAYQLFNQRFQYKQAVDTIAASLEKQEPGAYAKVEKDYYARKKTEITN